MANTISVGDWLDALETEYLEDFVRDGGSTVKFAVVPSERKTELRTAAQSRCVELGCAFVELDAGSIRAHMPQDIFFGLATQLDWPQLARRVVLGIAADEGFSVDGIDPIDDAAVFEAIATVNGVEARSVRQELRPRSSAASETTPAWPETSASRCRTSACHAKRRKRWSIG